MIILDLHAMATANDAKLGLWRDYSRRYLDREQASMYKGNKPWKLTFYDEMSRTASTCY